MEGQTTTTTTTTATATATTTTTATITTATYTRHNHNVKRQQQRHHPTTTNNTFNTNDKTSSPQEFVDCTKQFLADARRVGMPFTPKCHFFAHMASRRLGAANILRFYFFVLIA